MEEKKKFGLGKTILLAAPSDVELHKEFEKNLEYYGFKVINASIELKKYPSLLDRIKVKFKQLCCNKNAKRDFFKNLLHKHIVELLSSYEYIDYALCITAQRYNKETIKFIKSKTKIAMINYQYDGMNRFPEIYNYINLFDRFYVFDPDDVKDDLIFITNFFFDYDVDEYLDIPEVYFYNLSAHRSDRIKVINNIAKYAKENDLPINFKVRCSPREIERCRNLYENNIELITSSINFRQNLDNAKKAKVLVDFVISEHNGLSFRVFEALKYNKKLITTNKTIVNYDFYHPNNIFILNDNIDELEDFLNKPYIINQNIRSKYSFYSWIRFILDS